jgi:S-adenosylmethionine-diacylglycerol 3-amino-3-carboxypropyl transferase
MISYSQCWEDAEVLIGALKPSPHDTVLSVTSGGCNTLALAASGVSTVYSIDKNSEQNYLLELKLKAIQTLDNEMLLEFLGYKKSSKREELYNRISHNLTSEAKNYWDKNGKAIGIGIAHCGKFEKYLRVFQRYILPLVHTKKRVAQLLNPKGSAEQQIFYDTRWNTSRWRLMFRVFFSRFVMSRSGRSPEMFTHSQNISASQLYFKRTERALYSEPVKDNFFLSYTLLGSQSELLPYYLHKLRNKNSINLQNIKILDADILSFLKGMPNESIDKFNLSDIFEPLDIETTNKVFYEIIRTAKPNARLIFWNNLVSRDIPETLKPIFKRDLETESKLREIDRVFFYEKFYVYEAWKTGDGRLKTGDRRRKTEDRRQETED